MARKKPTKDELDELDQLYVRLTGMSIDTPKPKYPGKLVFIILLLLLLIGGFLAATACFGTLFDEYLTMGHVTVAGVDLGGMAKAQAKKVLSETVTDAYTATPMVIQVQDTAVTLSPQDTGICPDWNAAVNAAFRTGAVGEFELHPYLNLDLDAIRRAVDTLGSQYNTELSQTQCYVEGSPPSLALGEEADSSSAMTLTVKVGIPDYSLDTDTLYRQILNAYNKCTFTVTGECTAVQPQLPDLDALYKAHCIAPVDAVMDNKTFTVTPETYGYGFDLEQARTALSQAAYGQTLTFPFSRIPPAVTAQSLTSVLFRDVLGTCKTPYSGSDSNNRNTNLRLACEAINGKVLYPGETFTFNYTLGQRTAAKGYKPAASYVNGKTVDTYGGGICQVSSTLYHCTLQADLEIVERWPHGFISSYTAPGMDASVSWNSGDFRFKNNTNYPIRIEASRAKGYVEVTLRGTDEKDYYIDMRYSTVSSTPYKTVYVEYPPDNKEGYQDGQVLDTPYTGYKINTYKYKYDKETKQLLSEDFVATSVYSKRDKVIVRIVSPEPVTPPADPNAPSIQGSGSS
ncbi:MAG: VanW family protein [Oscillospiraceae bacterium]|nr:VanW family protein [Oscillospiraceae bacterium]